MTNQTLPDDPFRRGLARHVAAVRSGELSVEPVVRQCLQRISQLDARLNAYQYVAEEQALQFAIDMDNALQRGEKPGPLAGLPIGVKDIFTVADMPTTNGSMHPNTHLNPQEGSVVRALKAAGCIVIGKTRTVEYALGATGINGALGTPVNAWDVTSDRIPGGSSSGSAVAVAAGLCAFALGSDTGGSVRNPACLNGLVGHKTTLGRWPTDGIFPLSFSLDTGGPLCRTTADAALIHTVVTGEPVPPPAPLESLRLGRPGDYFFTDLDDAVRESFELAFEKLAQAGVTFVDIELAEAQERDHLFPLIVPSELIAQLTPAGFAAIRKDMDEVTELRAAHGLKVLAADYLQAQRRSAELREIAAQKMAGLDGWIAPTCPFTAMPITQALGDLYDRAMTASRNTMPVNLFGLTALTLPTAHLLAAGSLPTGLQLVAAANEDAKLLSMGESIEQCLGAGSLPDVNGFLSPH